MSTLNLFGDKNGGNSSNRASGIVEPGVLGVSGVQLTPSPLFGKSVNPITTRMADYVHYITTCTPIFSKFRHPCALLPALTTTYY